MGVVSISPNPFEVHQQNGKRIYKRQGDISGQNSPYFPGVKHE